MRVLLKLKAVKDFEYDYSYYTKVQALIYNLIRGTGFNFLHDKHGFKFFCFSNLYPIEEDGFVKEGSIKRLIISSPNKEFIEVIYRRLRRIWKKKDLIRIGSMEFNIIDVKKFDIDIPDHPFAIYTATPVIVRIQRKYYPIFGIKNDKNYVFWRSMYGAKSFFYMTKLNLFKKFREFYGYPPKSLDIYNISVLRKDNVVAYIDFGGNRFPQIGSMWKFIYIDIDYNLKHLLKFMVDVGLGERNSMGFGFLNIKEI